MKNKPRHHYGNAPRQLCRISASDDIRAMSLKNISWRGRTKNIRTRIIFAMQRYETIGELIDNNDGIMLRIPNIGKKSVVLIQKKLAELGCKLDPYMSR
jgi:hypothetical protein